LLGAPEARADQLEAQHAIELGRQALADYSRGAFDDARRGFEAAERAAHSPVFVLYLARCERSLGKFLKARELLRAVTAENLRADAPGPWQLAVTSAQAELASLDAQIPSLLIEGADPSSILRVTLDDRELDLSNGELEVDPGAHVLVVAYRDGTSERRSVPVESRERRRVDLSKQLPGGSRLAPAPSAALAPRRVVTDRSDSSLRTWSYVALGAGAASLGVGLVTGAVAMSKIDDVEGRCSEARKCRPEEAARVESASDWAAVSTLSFIAAGGFLTMGTTALFVSSSARKDEVRLVARGSF
jgi:hypothetical protein